jgi:hypothetical protein
VRHAIAAQKLFDRIHHILVVAAATVATGIVIRKILV